MRVAVMKLAFEFGDTHLVAERARPGPQVPTRPHRPDLDPPDPAW